MGQFSYTLDSYCMFSTATVTNCHKLSCLKQCKFIITQFGRTKNWYRSQNPFPFFFFLNLLEAPHIPWHSTPIVHIQSQKKIISLWWFFSIISPCDQSGETLVFNLYFNFNCRIITLQYCDSFCHTSTWISRRYTYVPSLLYLPSTSFPCPHL